MRTVLMFVLLTAALTACGFKAPLYLPDAHKKTQSAP